MVNPGARLALGTRALAVKDRSREYWAPDKRWAGDTVFVLGGGDSLRGFDCSRLRPHGWLLAVNSSFSTAPYSDAVYFNDYSWFMGKLPNGGGRRKGLECSNALLITTSRQAKGASPDRLKLIKMSAVSTLRGLRQGRSSGQSAISIAAALGASRVVLLGFDMRRVNGRSHHHNEYGSTNDRLYSHDFVPAFAGWQKMALKEQLQVLNATPGSVLKEFPFIKIEEVLS